MSFLAACYPKTNQSMDPDVVQRLSRSQQHRGDCQIYSNESNSMQIQFSGRLYDVESLRSSLKTHHHFQTFSEAELLLHLYEDFGNDFLKIVDGVFALAIRTADHRLIVARDRLGQMPLYLGHLPAAILLASELKAFTGITRDYGEFPINTLAEYDLATLQLIRESRIHAAWQWPTEQILDIESAKRKLRLTLEHAVAKRLGGETTGVYLSGGLDSSIIAALAARIRPGLHTFAVGFGDSEDLKHARLCADLMGTTHHEYRYDLKEMLDVLPAVIRHLESFDAALVRSSVPNFLLARLASGFVSKVLSGEGADELFCGYAYMHKLPQEALRQELLDILETLGNTGLQRGDRMSMSAGLVADVPFLDSTLIELALMLPLTMKIGPDGVEKWILREAFADLLPVEVTHRKKQKFSAGAGSQLVLAQAAESLISDHDFAAERQTATGHHLRSKEDLLYYRIFREQFPDLAAEKTVAFSRSL